MIGIKLHIILYFIPKLCLFEASYFDLINMTENWLEYDRKKITPTNMNDGTRPKHYTDEHERLNMTKIPMKMTEIVDNLDFYPLYQYMMKLADICHG